ncbi:MAG: hypothetical protein VW362_09895 [Candidatus Nanopelagicales bacterium]
MRSHDIPNRNTRQFETIPVHVPQNVGPASPKLFVCVESPWYTQSQTGFASGTDLGIHVAAVALPFVDKDGANPNVKADIPTQMLAADIFAQCYVTDRDADSFPKTARIQLGTAQRDLPVTKLYCGPTLAGRPFRTQVITATPADGKWWMTGSINQQFWGTAQVDGSSNITVDIGLTADGGSTIDPLMPNTDPEYAENIALPAESVSSGLVNATVAAGDIVIAEWIGDRYYVIPAGCSEA